jgi:hypothetical protein
MLEEVTREIRENLENESHNNLEKKWLVIRQNIESVKSLCSFQYILKYK